MRAAGRLTFLGAPLRSSLATEGSEGAATPLRTFAVSGASLAGVQAIDGGDIPFSPPGTSDYLPGGATPKNEGRVRESLLAVASRVGDTVREGNVPVVFGGDATVLLGLFAGLHDGRAPPPRLGLLAVDGLARFRTTADAPAGDLSTMVIALAVGRGQLSLAHLARERFPLVQETDVVLAGVRDATPDEAASLVKSRMTLLPPDRLRGSGGDATFMGVLGRHAQRTRELVLQFDVSVLDPTHFPVGVGFSATGGLPLERLRTLAGELARWNADGTIRIAGVSVTGVDARKDPGGVRMHELAGFVLRLLGRRAVEP
ncbi:MAG: arginase family protein, partial [Thermoplasmata archaeon]|nr:arginase family protein [Thermoplasmata archaeon]